MANPKINGESHFRGQLGEVLVRKAELEDLVRNAFHAVSTDEEHRLLLKAVTTLHTDVGKLLEEVSALPIHDDSFRSPGRISNGTKRDSGLQRLGPSPRSHTAFTFSPTSATCKEEPYSEQKLMGSRSMYSSRRLSGNLHYPDQHKLFLPHLNMRTTEETLYHYFSQYGTVIEMRIFELPANRKTQWNCACVGFESVATARALLHEKFFIDGVEIIPRPYRSNTKPVPTGRVKQTEYQIFLGGIPVQASTEDVENALRGHLYYGIRDVRVIYINENDRIRHRGFAYIDLESVEDAKYLLGIRYIHVCNRKVECKANTRTKSAILNDPKTIPPELMEEDIADTEENQSEGGLSAESNTVTDANPYLHENNGITDGTGKGNEFCIICKSNPQDCVMLWCGHIDTCFDCGNKLKNCPHIGCGNPIEQRKNLSEIRN